MKKKDFIFIILLFLFSFLIRSFQGVYQFPLSGEVGDNLLDIKNIVFNNQNALLGPATSHPWLYFGPLYFWIMIIVEKAFNFNPLGVYWFGIFTGSLIPLINFLVINKLFERKTAIISSLLLSVSPIFISFSKDARFYSLTLLIFYLFLYQLDIVFKKKKGFILLGFIYGLFFHFHYSPLIFIPVILWFLVKKKMGFKKLLLFVSGFVVPFIPLIINDAKDGFRMFLKLVIWIPYRVAGFLSIYPKNNPSIESFKVSYLSFEEFIGKNFVFNENLWLFVLIGFILVLILTVFKTKKYYRKNIIYQFLIFLLFLSVSSVFIHGDAPVHYFLPVFPIPIILTSVFLTHVLEKKAIAVMVFVIFILLILKNANYLLEGKKRHSPYYFSLEPSFVSLGLQYEIADRIIKNAKGKDFCLERIGPNDEFEENYSQNYKYILWQMGNEPKDNSKICYIVIEGFDENSVPKREDGELLFNDGKIGLLKYVKK